MMSIKSISIDALITVILVTALRWLVVMPGIAQPISTTYFYSIAFILLLIPPVIASIWIRYKEGPFLIALLVSTFHVVFLGSWASGFLFDAIITNVLSLLLLVVLTWSIVSIIWFVLNQVYA